LPVTVPDVTAARLPSVSTAPSPTLAAATVIAYAAPVDTVGRPVNGLKVTTSSSDCDVPSAGSDSVGDVEVYRCGPGLDPCWYDAAGGLLCMQTPWDTSALHPVAKDVPLGVNVATTDLDYPWGVKLTSGERCIAVQGAHSAFQSRVVDYGCSGPIKGLMLLRGLNRSAPLWTFQTTIWNGTTEVAGPTVAVATAWFAGPPPPRVPAPICAPKAVKVTVDFDRQLPMEAGVDFQNASPSECRLSGYPTVTVLDSAGRQLFQVARSTGPDAPTDITIPPWGSAGAFLDGNPDYPNGSCSSYTRLRVTVPGATTSTLASTGPLIVCPHAQISPIEVG
jgi:hypothetical protein